MNEQQNEIPGAVVPATGAEFKDEQHLPAEDNIPGPIIQLHWGRWYE